MSKIYTKTGDKGSTSLIGGTRVPKNDFRLDAYGTADELNSFLGLLRSYISDSSISDEILDIQNFLFDIGSFLATDIEKILPVISKEKIAQKIKFFEERIDFMSAQLPVLGRFILPGGNLESSTCHVCRTICRRLERRMYDVNEYYHLGDVLVYVNRLSDYLFVLSRYLSYSSGLEEIFRE